jgi:hypothetical protein
MKIHEIYCIITIYIIYLQEWHFSEHSILALLHEWQLNTFNFILYHIQEQQQEQQSVNCTIKIKCSERLNLCVKFYCLS